MERELVGAVGRGPADARSRRRTSSALNLRLDPAKPLVIHGENGVSQKADGRGQGVALRFVHAAERSRETCRSRACATLCHGTAWMDHEWFTHQLDPSQVAGTGSASS